MATIQEIFGDDVLPKRPPRRLKLPAWVQRHATSLMLMGGLLLVIGLVHGINMHAWPGRVNDDEGTYVAQAWAVVEWQSLAHYTYWYDHPPLGWLLIAGWAFLTDGFGRTYSSLMVGREFMLLTNLACCALLYIFARRLDMRRTFAAVAVVLFAFAPVALHYHRMVFLDNMAVAWALAALVFAASRRRGLLAAAGTALCFAAAVLTKETTALLFPFVIWVFIQNTDKHTRRWNWYVLWTLTIATGFTYILYAILKTELLASPDKVSLETALRWQLGGRPGSGSLLNPDSGTFSLAKSWVDMDPWLLLGGLVLIPAGFFIWQLRPIAAALLFQILVMCGGSYMPYPYVIALLPFCALLIAGTANRLWHGPSLRGKHHTTTKFLGGIPRQTVVIVAALVFAIAALPGWTSTLASSVTVDLAAPSYQATEWIKQNVAKDAVVVVDDYIWPDLAREGFTKQIWFYKADLDPAVKKELLPNGYASIDYVVLGNLADSTMKDLPTVAQAIQQSEVVAVFGDYEVIVRKVTKP